MVFFLRFLLLCSVVWHGPGLHGESRAMRPLNREYRLETVFAGLQFEQPIGLKGLRGTAPSLFVVERTGKIFVITNLAAPTKTLFLDLSADTNWRNLEAGLLGFALHPRYLENGEFFVLRSTSTINPGETVRNHNQLSKFRSFPGELFRADRASETILIRQQDQAAHSHNAGDVQFGPDGYLYFTIGDLAPPVEHWTPTRQPIDKAFFGALSRIDVDNRPENLLPNPFDGISQGYKVPSDNPFIGATSHLGYPVDPKKVRSEIYALGFRNPWRFGIHAQSGAIIVGDVGEVSFEEINLIQKGANYGWPYFEGNLPARLAPPAGIQPVAPLHAYPHGKGLMSGHAVVGGAFYGGANLPELKDSFLFGDNVRGNIWAWVGGEAQWIAGEPGLTTFGIDPRDEEILVVGLKSGQIRKLSRAGVEAFPELLSETAFFRSLVPLVPSDFLTPFEVNVPFWSDQAEKSRWIGFLGVETNISYIDRKWRFPEGTLFVKHFQMPAGLTGTTPVLIETRFLVQTKTGMEGVTYKWNAAGTDAQLVRSAGEDIQVKLGSSAPSRPWHLPARHECAVCHNEDAGGALGFSAVQLNKILNSGTNQLHHLQRAGILKNVPSILAGVPALAPQQEARASHELRIRSYLAANCSSCHFPDSGNIANWDARFETPMDKKSFMRQLLNPASLDTSPVVQRLSYNDYVRMPPIASAILDTNSLYFLTNWAARLNAPGPWIGRDLNPTANAGSMLISGNTIELAGYGPNGGEGLGGYKVFLPVRSDTRITGRLHVIEPASGMGGMFVALEDSSDFLAVGISNNLPVTVSAARGVARIPDTPPIKEGEEFSLAIHGGLLEFAVRQNDAWRVLQAEPWSTENPYAVGFIVLTTNRFVESLLRFNEVSVISAQLETFPKTSEILESEPVELWLDLTGVNPQISRVTYLEDGAVVGTSSKAPYTFQWRPRSGGQHQIQAWVETEDGLTLRTTARSFQVVPQSGGIAFRKSDQVTRGNWEGVYGSKAMLTPEIIHTPAGTPQIGWRKGAIATGPATIDDRYVRRPGSSAVTRQYWSDDTIEFEIQPGDAEIRQLTLYFANFEGGNGSVTVKGYDLTTGALLLSHLLDLSGGALHASFDVRGSLKVQLSGAPGVNLMAIFFDDSTRPQPSLALPDLPKELFIPGYLPIEAIVPADEAWKEMRFYLDGRTLGKNPGSFLEAVITNLPAGEHIIDVFGTDPIGRVARATRSVQAVLPKGKAYFIGSDTTTQGNWRGRYGATGQVLIGDSTNLPPWITITPTNHYDYVAAIQDDYGPAPERAAGGGRVFGAWVGPYGSEVEIELEDGLEHVVSIYVFDEPGVGKPEQLILRDRASRAVLDVRSASGIPTGTYYTWSVQGSIAIEIKGHEGSPAVVNAVFFDPSSNSPPRFNGLTLDHLPSGRARFEAAAFDPDGVVGFEVYHGTNCAEIIFGHEAGMVARTQPGTNWVTVMARDARGYRTAFAPLKVVGSGQLARPEFVGRDLTTLGFWQGNYGSRGFAIADWRTNFPYTPKPMINEGTATWRWSLWGKDRALKTDFGEIPSGWFNSSPLQVSMVVPPGQGYDLTLYFADYDAVRTQEVILKGLDGSEYDRRTISSFYGGEYNTWAINGPTLIEIVPKAGGNGVLQGIFLDRRLRYRPWASGYFGASELNTPQISGPEADVDSDLRSNEEEFLWGTDPLRADSALEWQRDPVTGSVLFAAKVNSLLPEGSFRFQVSFDLATWNAPRDLGYQTEEVISELNRLVICTIPKSAAETIFVRTILEFP